MLILLCFTSDAAVVAATGYGAMVAAGGAAVNIATDVTDMVTKSLENSEMTKFCALRNEATDRSKEECFGETPI